jgi:hypothetical protein
MCFEDGNFDRSAPGEALAFVNDLERHVGASLYGRRMYETTAGGRQRSSRAGSP